LKKKERKEERKTIDREEEEMDDFSNHYFGRIEYEINNF